MECPACWCGGSTRQERRHQFGSSAITLDQATALDARLHEEERRDPSHPEQRMQPERMLGPVLPLAALTDRTLVQDQIRPLTGDRPPQYRIGSHAIWTPALARLGIFRSEEQQEPGGLVGNQTLSNVVSFMGGGTTLDGHARMVCTWRTSATFRIALVLLSAGTDTELSAIV
jgi:hypothetical protein